MPEFSDSLLILLRGLGLLALVSMSYGWLIRRTDHPPTRSIATGILFGTGIVFSMIDPVRLVSGLLFDARGVLLILAAPFGGWPAAVIAAAMAAGFRLWEGGLGAISGVLSISIAAGTGILFARYVSKSATGYSALHLVGLALLSNLMLLALLLLPLEIAIAAVSKMFVPVTLANTVGIILLGQFLNREMARYEAEKRLERDSLTDPLTELPNRRLFDRVAAGTLSRAQAGGETFSLVMIDIDRFKTVNDSCGHDAGDMVLRAVAEIVRSHVRASDIVARYGGEEIAVLLPAADLVEAQRIAETVRQRIDMADFGLGEHASAITVSAGVASYSATCSTLETLFKAADAALYSAKRLGRNRVETALAAPA